MEELDFLDLVVLHRVDNETTVEKFGSRINTSFFEAANILGTMKVKGLIDFEHSLAATHVTATSKGGYVLEVAAEKIKEPFSDMDQTILETIAFGANSPQTVCSNMNLKSDDLAYHLEKMYTQGYVDYTIRSGDIRLALTEKGFGKIGKIKREVKAEDVQPVSKDAENIVGTVQEPPEQSEGESTEISNDPARIQQSRAASKMEYYLKRYWHYAVIFVLVAVGTAAYFFLR